VFLLLEREVEIAQLISGLAQRQPVLLVLTAHATEQSEHLRPVNLRQASITEDAGAAFETAPP